MLFIGLQTTETNERSRHAHADIQVRLYNVHVGLVLLTRYFPHKVVEVLRIYSNAIEVKGLCMVLVLSALFAVSSVSCSQRNVNRISRSRFKSRTSHVDHRWSMELRKGSVRFKFQVYLSHWTPQGSIWNMACEMWKMWTQKIAIKMQTKTM
jgi:hypothetical protein